MVLHDEDPRAFELFGDGSPPRNTREKLLFTALDLFYTYGFHAVGLDQILGAAGLTKTTFYNHFESKDALVLEAVRLRDRWEGEAFMKDLHAVAGYDPRALLMGCFDVLERWFTDPRYRGCLFLSAMTEYPLAEDPVHRAAAGHYRASTEVLADIAKAAGAADPGGLAREWVALMLSCFSQKMAYDDDQSVAVARRIAAARLEDHLADAG